MMHIRSALAGAMLVLGAAAVASAQQQTQTPQTSTPQAHQHGQFRRGPGRHFGGQRALFKGITLSDAEKANLKAVHAKYETQMKTLRAQSKPDMQALRDARQKGDTAALRALREKNAPQREQAKQLMQSERNDLRNALTPANQAKFDANAKQMEQRFAKRAEKGKAGRRAGGF